MGDTYLIEIADKSAIIEGKLEGRMTLVGDLDRAIYLRGLLDAEFFPPCKIDPAYGSQVCSDLFYDQQMYPITPEQLRHAIKVLEDLDAKVRSMPFDTEAVAPGWEPGAFATIIGVTQLKDGETIEDFRQCNPDIGYVEPCGPEYGIGGNQVYFGRNKRDVDILKEVVKVYKWKYYHYSFPWWRNSSGGVDTMHPEDGANYLIQQLKKALGLYESMHDKEKRTLLVHWY
jgi:hypothetical protein